MLDSEAEELGSTMFNWVLRYWQGKEKGEIIFTFVNVL